MDGPARKNLRMVGTIPRMNGDTDEGRWQNVLEHLQSVLTMDKPEILRIFGNPQRTELGVAPNLSESWIWAITNPKENVKWGEISFVYFRIDFLNGVLIGAQVQPAREGGVP